MIFSLPPLSTETKTPQDETPIEGFEVAEMPYEYRLEKAGGIQLPDDQYIIDPDYAGALGIDNWEDLIKTKR